MAFVDFHLCLVEVTDNGYDVDVILSNGSTVYEYLIPPVINNSVPLPTTTESLALSSISQSTTPLRAVFVVLVAVIISLIGKKRKS